MKTNCSNNQLRKIVLFTLLIIFFIQSASAANFNGSFGVRLSSTISANRFGPSLSPSLLYQSNRSMFTLGVMLQNKRYKIDGLQINYEFTLLDSETDQNCNLSWLGLYAFCNFGYHNKAFLNSTACEEEYCSNKELSIDPAKIEMKALEAYGGFGLRISLLKRFKWFNSIGIGGYNVITPVNGLYYNTRNLGLLLRTGFTYQLSKGMKTNF
jgi:hypothetical protein